MPIHASSVISTQIQSFDNTLYVSLTDKENYCYTAANANIIAPSTPITIYQPKFQALNDAIVSYLSASRNGIISDVISNFVGYYMMHILYGTDYAQQPSLLADTMFTINAAQQSIPVQPVSAYADYNGVTFTSLDTIISSVNGAFTAEQTSIESIQNSMTAIVKAQSLVLMMNDVTPIAPAPTKQDIGNTIFGSGIGQLQYKQYNTILNFNLTVPSYAV